MDSLLKTVGTAFMKDTLFLLKHDPEFLNQPAEQRRKVMESYWGSTYPKSLAGYLLQLTASTFKQEFQHIIQVLEEVAQANPENSFLNALSAFLVGDLGAWLDALPLNFFFRPLGERLEILEERLPACSALNKALKREFSENTFQELTSAAHRALEILKNAPVVLVQTPVEIEEGMRKQIRQHFSRQTPHAFVEFQINPQILGGMRLFVNGEVEDRSWLSKVQAIMRLHELRST